MGCACQTPQRGNYFSPPLTGSINIVAWPWTVLEWAEQFLVRVGRRPGHIDCHRPGRPHIFDYLFKIGVLMIFVEEFHRVLLRPCEKTYGENLPSSIYLKNSFGSWKNNEYQQEKERGILQHPHPSCHGLNYVLPTDMLKSKPHYPWMWYYLEIGSSQK